MRAEMKRLYNFGFAVHLLHPKSKRPIDLKWTSGARKPWKTLKAEYRKGMNIGVRLGKASKIEGRYLAVIDCDVKSTDGRHLKEMKSALKKMLGASAAPLVFSGRGNGSRHLYVTVKEPVRGYRLAQSSEKVKAHMPSSAPSKFELKTLSPKEIKSGTRLKPAWEISFMCEGQQVVLPPSIHPDSGKPYRWAKLAPLPDDLKDLPVIQARKAVPENKGVSVKEDFKAETVDLVSSILSDKTVNLIIAGEGEGADDRSSALLGVCNAMIKARFTDSQILSVLTEPDYFLGQVSYEHAQTSSRARAAEWVRKYTLEKAKRETSAEQAFLDDLEEEEPLDDEAAAKQLATLVPELDWRDKIERGGEEGGFRPKNTLQNVILILQGEGGSDVFKRDEFANSELTSCDTPWGTKKGAEITDIDTVRIKDWLSRTWRFEPSNDRINEAIMKIADVNRFHPVRDYLARLKWDGKPRIDRWLKTYLGAEAPEPYLSAVSRKVLCAMIKRIYEPGCKFDHVLILENIKQGIGKSTSVRMLAGDDWFSDATINVADKDAVLTMRSIWVIELGELSSMRKADVDVLKEFVSRTTDRIRVPYGKRTENFPRQCIFIGTTNSEEYLKDPTGNRRFWPVKVGDCDFKKIARDRDQLLAEAKVAYELGEPLYLEDGDMVKGALQEQEARTITDSWEEILQDWLTKEEESDEENGGQKISREQFTMIELFSDFGPLADWKPNQPEVKRAGEALRKLGFQKTVLRKKGVLTKTWIRRIPLLGKKSLS